MAEKRTGILSAVSNWLKLLALIVLVGEAVIIAAMGLTPSSHPLFSWYPLFMLLFLVVIVVGVFIDRAGERKERKLTLPVGDKEVSIDTDKTMLPKSETALLDVESNYIDSQRGFTLKRPTLPGWSAPEQLDMGGYALKVGLIENIEKWNENKEAAAVVPMGRMLVEAGVVLFEYGKPIELELTDDTSNVVVDTVINRLIDYSKKEGVQPTDKQIRDFRKGMIRGGMKFERLMVHNSFAVIIFEKELAQNSPIVLNLANLFLKLTSQVIPSLNNLASNEDSIMFGYGQTLTKVLVNKTLREVTTYSVSRLLQSEKRMFQLAINWSPQTEADISVWEELKGMLGSFRVIA